MFFEIRAFDEIKRKNIVQPGMSSIHPSIHPSIYGATIPSGPWPPS